MTLRRRRPGLVYPTWEDWHYVGDGTTGLGTTFGTDWTNVGSPWPALAFRHREAGVVDLVGVVQAGAVTTGEVFTLPASYRPTEQTFMPFIRLRSASNSGQLLSISDTGQVVAVNSGVSGDVNYISGNFFIDTAAP